MIHIIKKVGIISVLITLLCGALIFLFVQHWSFTDQGRLPPKTAVVLHAFNNQLVTAEMNPPRILTRENVPAGGGSSSVMIKEDILIPMSEVSIPARVYRPSGDGSFPMVMYYHGGAFLEGFGSIETHDNIARSLSQRTQSIVISVGYRVAPTHTFPTAIEDSYGALLWAVQNAEELNGDPNRVAVVGDSAGGNIATVVAAMARDRNGPELSAQVLLYPVTTFQEVPLSSRDQYANGYYLLSRGVMEQARAYYTPEEAMWLNPYTSPLHADDLSNLPAAFIITAEFDPLRDEGEAYAERLAESGVYVEAARYKGVMHGFISFYEVMYKGKHGLNETSSFLQRAFNEELGEERHELQIVKGPWGFDRVQENAEAYAFAAFLLGKQGMSYLTDFYSIPIK